MNELPGSADVLVGMNKNGADGDVSVPRKEWYFRGYLPHRDASHLIQSVTYRLADSLPQTKLNQLKEELDRFPEKQRDIERRKRIEHLLDAGMGCCALRHPEVARYVQDSFLHFHGSRYHLHAWSIMPNHVHVLLEPLMPLAPIVQGWKSFTARWILQKNEALALKIPSSDQLWMREYWDRYIRDAEHYQKTIEYIHQNPMKAGLCQAAEVWPWSSAFLGNGSKNDADEDVSAPRNDADEDVSAPRNDADEDVSAPRNDADEDVSAPRNDADEDVSAPREVTF